MSVILAVEPEDWARFVATRSPEPVPATVVLDVHCLGDPPPAGSQFLVPLLGFEVT
jgi:hypothetical protein